MGETLCRTGEIEVWKKLNWSKLIDSISLNLLKDIKWLLV